jgi:uncharacterized protein YbbC (DUF1343 family)
LTPNASGHNVKPNDANPAISNPTLKGHDMPTRATLSRTLSLILACMMLAVAVAPVLAKPKVFTGLDVMQRDDFAALEGKKVGLITNHSGINARGEHILDLMHASANVELVAIFTPEHGIRGEADRGVDSGVDETTGLTIHSLYGKTRKPTDEMLEGINTLVFDIQDIGARFYTYIGTLGECMNAAAKRGIKVYVLDRPNPLGGTDFDGPIQDDDLVGNFTSFKPMPTTHGMTVGEIALMFNGTYGIGCELEVIQCQGWERGMMFDETGLPWVNPSPNMRSVNEEIIYTMVALTEGNKDLSVGRGTDRPFEYLGAPWVDGDALTAELRSRDLPGIWVMHATFIPSGTDISGRENYPYQYIDEVCQGVRFVVTDRRAVQPVVAGTHMLDALLKVHPERFKLDKLRRLVGAQWVLDALNAREPVEEIVTRWREDPAFKDFAEARKQVLLYD